MGLPLGIVSCADASLNKRDIIVKTRLHPTINAVPFSKRYDPYDFLSVSVSVIGESL
jgi:hypothetical protein